MVLNAEWAAGHPQGMGIWYSKRSASFKVQYRERLHHQLGLQGVPADLHGAAVGLAGFGQHRFTASDFRARTF
jgi:hypothetical protein